jgi:hypothetical protein
MRRISLLMCLVAISCASWAQSDKASWTNLSTLQAGQKIEVVDMKSRRSSGTFVSFTDTAIKYQGTTGEQNIPKQDVRKVKLMENKHRLRNTLIGAGVGAGAGAGVGAAAYQGCESNCIGARNPRGLSAGIGALVGFLAGAVVGALLPSHSTVYSVNAH